MSDETPRTLLIRQLREDAVMVCRSGCIDFGDGNKPLDDRHCWACGISFRMRQLESMLSREVAPSDTAELQAHYKAGIKQGRAEMALQSSAPSLPPTVEEAREKLDKVVGRLLFDRTSANLDAFIACLDALLAAQRHASAQEIERLTNDLEVAERRISDSRQEAYEWMCRAEQAEAQLTGWQPIATAPKYGTRFVIAWLDPDTGTFSTDPLIPARAWVTDSPEPKLPLPPTETPA